MSDDNVTALPGLPVNPLHVERDKAFCGHDAILIDVHERAIHCAKCRAVLNAFDYLRSNGETIERAWWSYRDVMHRTREASERLHELKKEEQRLRAKIKRLTAKGGDVVVVRRRDDE